MLSPIFVRGVRNLLARSLRRVKLRDPRHPTVRVLCGAAARLRCRPMSEQTAATAEAEPTSRYAQVNGLRLHYFDWGGDESARIFVLCHGGSAHAHWWDQVAPQLKRYGRVIALDRRGHGRSAWAEVYGAGNHIADLKAFLRE